MKSGITTHTIVRNEDRYIWFAINAVIGHVDRMFIYDTGSTDRTAAIIKAINNPKIIFETKGVQSAEQITHLRQEQLDRTQTDWFLILDGDEVWWCGSIKAVLQAIMDHSTAYGVITPTINCIGDIYHYQDDSAGKYHFAGKTGHLAVRAIRRTIPGLKLRAAYPLEGYYHRSGRLITDYADKLVYVDQPYLHLTNLSRSTATEKGVISRKKKYELGHRFSADFKYPEVFYRRRPTLIPDPWIRASVVSTFRGALETPLKKIKRSFL